VDKRERAFGMLEQLEAGDLIKVVVSVVFGRREYAEARKLVERLEKAGYAPQIEKNTPWNTLTAWLREQWPRLSKAWAEGDKSVPDRTRLLEALGATVGWVVKLKKRK
jgi:hypothetical protein